VRGDSRGIPCAGSKSDCLLIDEVSVLLLLSAKVRVCGFGCEFLDGMAGVALPVMSRFLKASTSSEARGRLLSGGNESASSAVRLCLMADRNGSSIVASVRLNGFGGAPCTAFAVMAGSDICSVSVLLSSSLLDSSLSNGSSSSSSSSSSSRGKLRANGVEGVS
jgi:hypothetical protein